MLSQLRHSLGKLRTSSRVFVDYWNGSLNVAYSQEGEDLILKRILDPLDVGFYVDVGAFSPKWLSNTYTFYIKGWRGINIDARPGSMAHFAKIRPRDINLELAISDCPGRLTYYMFDPPTLNGFSTQLSQARATSAAARLLGTKDLITRSLAEVLDEHLPPSQQIDFLTVDVEGFDLQVLRSNDWSRFRPTLVLMEVSPGAAVADSLQSPAAQYMIEIGYELYAKAVNTLIFKDRIQGVPSDGVSRKHAVPM
jgi:FkbM family methyltransferase